MEDVSKAHGKYLQYAHKIVAMTNSEPGEFDEEECIGRNEPSEEQSTAAVHGRRTRKKKRG